MLLLLAACLVCYRIARLISIDRGPYDVFHKMRSFWGRLAAHNFQSRFLAATVRTVADLFHCPYCSGVWVALFIAAFVRIEGVSPLLVWFACAGGQAVLASFERNGENE